MAKFDRSNTNLHNAQIDSSEFILELQLSIIYLFESICSVINSLLRKFWVKFINLLSQLHIDSIFHSLVFRIKTYSLNNRTCRSRLLEWIQKKIPAQFRPNNFNTDWRDGILLCALCQAIAPGCCPRYDLLSSSTPLNNLKLALFLIENHLNIKPDITENEIYNGNNETKLVHLLWQLKILEATNRITDSKNEDDDDEINEIDTFFDDWCFIRGMGTIVGVRAHRCRFSIFHGFDPVDFTLDIEILGPNDSMCSERIVLKNGLKTISKNLPWHDDALNQWLTMRAAKKIRSDETNLKIPIYLEYMENHVRITYIPLLTGQHQISIIWQGRHVLGSPYYASIEEPEYLAMDDLPGIGPRFTSGLHYPLCLLNTDQQFRYDHTGVVIGTKTLRRSVIIKGKEYDYYSHFPKHIERSKSEQQPDSSHTIMRTNSLAIPDAENDQKSNSSEYSNKKNDFFGKITNKKEIMPFRTLPIKKKNPDGSCTDKNTGKSYSLRQILNENNENFTKELNKMAKNLKEKLERYKKQPK